MLTAAPRSACPNAPSQLALTDHDAAMSATSPRGGYAGPASLVGILLMTVALSQVPHRARANVPAGPHSISPPAWPTCLEFRTRPYLGVLDRDSDTVAVRFQLKNKPRRVGRVLVNGRTFRVHQLGDRRGYVYSATLSRPSARAPRMRVGQRYLLRVDVALRPHRGPCLLSVPYGHDQPGSGSTCSAGCSDSYLARLPLHANLQGFHAHSARAPVV
jgi:hypothetical protein